MRLYMFIKKGLNTSAPFLHFNELVLYEVPELPGDSPGYAIARSARWINPCRVKYGRKVLLPDTTPRIG
jgi:hypothetical protein